MPDYPSDERRSAAAERYPSRNPPLRTAVRRRVRKMITPLLGPMLVSRQTQLAALQVPPKHILFIGDSITDFGMWHEWFPEAPTVNRGVGGEVTAQVLARIDEALNDPIAVFLLIGTNDVSGGVPTADIVGNVRAIIAAIQNRAPDAPVFVESIMPRALKYREEITHLNRLYRDAVAEAGGNVRFLDLWPALATPEGTLRPELTADKLHLNGEGYRAWVDVLRPIINDLTQPNKTIGKS